MSDEVRSATGTSQNEPATSAPPPNPAGKDAQPGGSNGRGKTTLWRELRSKAGIATLIVADAALIGLTMSSGALVQQLESVPGFGATVRNAGPYLRIAETSQLLMLLVMLVATLLYAVWDFLHEDAGAPRPE